MTHSKHHSVQSTIGTAELVERCIDGSHQAKAIFFERYAPLVTRAVRREVRRAGPESPIEVEDVVQDIFTFLIDQDCRPLKSLHNPQSIDAWLMTVSQRRVRTMIRRQRARARHDNAMGEHNDGGAARSPRDTAQRREATRNLEKCLAKLNDLDRLILDLYYVHDKKYREIAALLDLNINTVAARIARARTKLRESLREDSHAG